jgi:hypothetical protein
MAFISSLQISLFQSYDDQYSYGPHADIAIFSDMRSISVVPSS